MRMRRRWRWLGIAAVLLASGWVLFARLAVWNERGNLRLAQEEIARGQLGAARRRLAALATRPGVLGGAAEYWLGICEAIDGNPGPALQAFGRVPAGFPFDSRGAVLEAEANLAQGRLRPAERRLEEFLARGGPNLDTVRARLGHIYRLEARAGDAKALLRASLAEAEEPVPVLKQISNFDLDRLPYEGLREALERAGRQAPDDDRVWLGRARLATLAGLWNEAADWLARCRGACPDAPVWMAELDWARGACRPEEALEAARNLGPEQLDGAERLGLWAWCEQQRGDARGESAALKQWLEVEPTATQALERLAELEHRAGRRDRAGELRRRKADVERALAGYRLRLWRDEPLGTATERSALAQLAEAAGHLHEARALYVWATEADPGDSSARLGLARLDRALARSQLAASTAKAPRPESAPPFRRQRAGPGREPRGGLEFVDIAQAAQLQFVYDNAETPIHQLPEPFGGGLALLDYDGDGWLDVYCVQGGPFTPSSELGSSSASSGDRLFHNRGDGTFEDTADRSGIASFPRGHGHGVTVGDVDGDGRPDLFVARWRSYALYRNRGDGAFEDVTNSWGLGGRRDWPTSAALADLDGDGDLDLYVCHYAAWDLDNPRICRDSNTKAYLNCNPLEVEALSDHLFRNDGHRFVDVTLEAGIIDRDGRGLGVVAADLDDDGRVDLFVANDSSANFLFRNLGGMRFEEVGHAAGVAGNASGTYQAGMGVAAGDLDGDGRIDLAVTNFYGESTTFYRNLGDCAFCDASSEIGLAVATRRLLGFGVAFFDADNDGRLDMASANGHVNDLRPNYPYRMPAQLLLGDSDGRLIDVSDQAGAAWTVPRMGRGLAIGDLDNDGREDVLILSHKEPLAYLNNRNRVGRFLTLRLEGSTSNRDAIGAKVTVIAAGRRCVAQRTGGGSFQSASDPRLHFGLGSVDRVESIEIVWPSGRVSRYRDLGTDTGYLLREGADHASSLKGFDNSRDDDRR
jgi:hypothetical protein